MTRTDAEKIASLKAVLGEKVTETLRLEQETLRLRQQVQWLSTVTMFYRDPISFIMNNGDYEGGAF